MNEVKKRGRPAGKYGSYKKKYDDTELNTLYNTTPSDTHVQDNTLRIQTNDIQDTSTSLQSVNPVVNTTNQTDASQNANLLNPAPVLEVKNLKKRYKTAAHYTFENMSFTIYEGDIVGILGENGAGKSTLLKCITGLTPTDGGVIKIKGRPLHEAHDDISTLWVEAGMQQDSTVHENLRFWNCLLGTTYTRTQFIELLAPFRIGHLIDQPYKLLSTGQKRKVSLARTFMRKTPLYILDEATSGLDFASQAAIQKHIREFVANTNSAFLFVTHLYSDLLNLCTKIIMIDSGSIVDYCTVTELTKRYLSGYVYTITLDVADDVLDAIKVFLNETGITYIIKQNVASSFKPLYIKVNNPAEFNTVEPTIQKYVATKNCTKLDLDLFISLLLQGVIFKPTY